MKKIISLALAFCVFFSFAIADYQEDIFLIQKTIIEEKMYNLNNNLNFGWEFIEENNANVLYSLYIFENGIKNDYAVDFIKSDDLSRIEGLFLYIFLDENTENDETQYLQLLDMMYIWALTFDPEDDYDSFIAVFDEYVECICECLDGNYSESYYRSGDNNSFLGVEYSKDLDAVKIVTYFGDAMPDFHGMYSSLDPKFYQTVLSKYNNYDRSEIYLAYFDAVWGELTKKEGCVVWGTLTPSQKLLVNYPAVDIHKVYTTPTGKRYHSTDLCYTLIDSQKVQTTTLKNAETKGYTPCSKCVE